MAGACASYRLESVATIGASRLLLRGDTLETRALAGWGLAWGTIGRMEKNGEDLWEVICLDEFFKMLNVDDVERCAVLICMIPDW